jgi:polyphosphate glucokinase
LSWKAWAQDLDEHLQRIEDLMWPTLFILGGGVSKNGDKFIPRLTVRTPVVAAQLRNDAGIIGAAIVAVEGLSDAKSTWDDLPEGKQPAAS